MATNGNGMTKAELAALIAVKEINRKIKDQRGIDWEQRRYEIARDVLAGYVAYGGNEILHQYYDVETRTGHRAVVKNAVFLADALIAELKKGEE